jgi:hypothetical protein
VGGRREREEMLTSSLESGVGTAGRVDNTESGLSLELAELERKKLDKALAEVCEKGGNERREGEEKKEQDAPTAKSPNH